MKLAFSQVRRKQKHVKQGATAYNFGILAHAVCGRQLTSPKMMMKDSQKRQYVWKWHLSAVRTDEPDVGNWQMNGRAADARSGQFVTLTGHAPLPMDTISSRVC
jgi:hypothetical protein